MKFYDATGLPVELSKRIHAKFYERFKKGSRDTASILLCGTEVLNFQVKNNFKFMVCNMTNTDHLKVPKKTKLISLRGMNLKGVTSASEHCMYLLLNLLKKTTRYGDPGRNLYKKKALIIGGMGRIGTQVGKMLRAFRMKVYTFDTKREIDFNPHIFMRADVIIMAASVQSNEHILKKHHIDALRDGAYLVNIARPCLIDEDAVAKNMHRLGGYGADFPLSDDFPKCVNVITTEHTGGYTWEDLRQTSDMCFYELMEKIL